MDGKPWGYGGLTVYFLKKYLWTHTVQTHVFQGPTVHLYDYSILLLVIVVNLLQCLIYQLSLSSVRMHKKKHYIQGLVVFGVSGIHVGS